LARILGVDVPAEGASFDSVQDALARSQQAEASQQNAEYADEYGFDKLSDDALLMANELVKKHYALPDLITERTVRLAHLGLKAYEQAQHERNEEAARREQTGYLDVEVFPPNNPN